MIIIVASVLNLHMEVVREMKIISSPEKNVNLVVVEKVSHEKYLCIQFTNSFIKS